MLKDITLGQYFPGKSFVHKLDPRTKLLVLVAYIVTLFMAGGWIGYGLCAAFLIVSILVSTIPVKSIVRGMKPLAFILLFTGILNVFFTAGETVLLDLGFVSVTLEGLQRAVFMMVRILLLVSGTFLLTYTTSPISLTDGLESLMSPLKVIHVPVHELSMMMCIALRFIPTLMEETEKIMNAQKSRGADFHSGSLIQRAKALLPIFIPLLSSAFKRADELANAMDCRCYHGGEGRTKLKVLHLRGSDVVGMVLVLMFGVGIFFLNRVGLIYTMS